MKYQLNQNATGIKQSFMLKEMWRIRTRT